MKIHASQPSSSYDVAISCLKSELPFAKELFSRLSKQLRVFLYSECQSELAGSDGVSTFTEIFKESSRLVVILHGEQWGKTKWTRVEETAIRDRFFDVGIDSIFLVRRDSSALPKWFPKAQIYADSVTSGIEEIADAIGKVAARVGCIQHPATPADLAREAQRVVALQKRREELLYSIDGYSGARSLVDRSFRQVGEAFEGVKTNFSSDSLCLSGDSRMVVLRLESSAPVSAVLRWRCGSANSISGAFLQLDLAQGVILTDSQRAGRIWIGNEPHILNSRTFEPYFETDGEWVWKQRGYEHRVLSSGELSTVFYEEFFALVARTSSGDLRCEPLSLARHRKISRI
jgi:hypothetical protein